MDPDNAKPKVGPAKTYVVITTLDRADKPVVMYGPYTTRLKALDQAKLVCQLWSEDYYSGKVIIFSVLGQDCLQVHELTVKSVND